MRTELVEKEFTIAEAAAVLGIRTARLAYAFRTNKNVTFRMAGSVKLVTLAQCKQALEGVRPYGGRVRLGEPVFPQ